MFLTLLIHVGVALTGIALLSAPLGNIVIWRRQSFLSDTLAHASILGIVVGTFFHLSPLVGGLGFVMLFVMLLWLATHHFPYLDVNTLLAVLSQGCLALSLVLVSLLHSSISMMDILFGDVLAITPHKVILITIMAIAGLLWVRWRWRLMLLMAINPDYVVLEYGKRRQLEMEQLLVVVLFIAISVHVLGALLATSLLVMPPLASRFHARSPSAMVKGAVAIGLLSVYSGMALALGADIPVGPAIATSALASMLISYLVYYVCHVVRE